MVVTNLLRADDHQTDLGPWPQAHERTDQRAAGVLRPKLHRPRRVGTDLFITSEVPGPGSDTWRSTVESR